MTKHNTIQTLHCIPKQQQSKTNDQHNSQNHALLYDPSTYQKQYLISKSKNYRKGMILQLKTVQINFSKKSTVSISAFMMTSENLSKVFGKLFDPNLQISINLEKEDHSIIQYLSQSSLSQNYKFLVGWFQANSIEGNKSIKQFAMKCDKRKKIYGIKNGNTKMHIMSIVQYTKITNFYEIPNKVAFQCSKNILNRNRLVYIIQYQLSSIQRDRFLFQNWYEIEIKYESHEVEVPDVVIIDEKYRPQNKLPDQQVKSHFYRKSHSSLSAPISNEDCEINKKNKKAFLQLSDYEHKLNPLNLINRFSPILTDEEDKIQEKQKQPKQKIKENKKTIKQNKKNTKQNIKTIK